jgi:hypothetical protein
VTDLDPAITTCGSLAELAQIASRYPAALDGVDARVFVTNRCAYAAADVVVSRICQEIRG